MATYHRGLSGQRGASHESFASPRQLVIAVLIVSLGALLACSKKSDNAARERAAARARGGAAAGPRLAVIVDDLGYDAGVAQHVFALPNRLTVAVLPNLTDSARIAREAHQRGFEVLLHLPMESLAGEDKAEKVELRVGEPAAEMERTLDSMLASVPHAVGVNNHQGSRATADAALMAALAQALRARGLFFIDSRTTANSVALDAVRRAGVAAAPRTVFLDDVEEAGAIRRQLERADHQAREQGWSLAIGHPHPLTLSVLAELLPDMEARGLRLVHASEIAQHNP